MFLLVSWCVWAAHCSACLLNLQATAVIRAAPFPLPSSDLWNVTWHCGAKSCKVSCIILEKLEGETKKVGYEQLKWKKTQNTFLVQL